MRLRYPIARLRVELGPNVSKPLRRPSAVKELNREEWIASSLFHVPGCAKGRAALSGSQCRASANEPADIRRAGEGASTISCSLEPSVTDRFQESASADVPCRPRCPCRPPTSSRCCTSEWGEPRLLEKVERLRCPTICKSSRNRPRGGVPFRRQTRRGKRRKTIWKSVSARSLRAAN